MNVNYFFSGGVKTHSILPMKNGMANTVLIRLIGR